MQHQFILSCLKKAETKAAFFTSVRRCTTRASQLPPHRLLVLTHRCELGLYRTTNAIIGPLTPNKVQLHSVNSSNSLVHVQFLSSVLMTLMRKANLLLVKCQTCFFFGAFLLLSLTSSLSKTALACKQRTRISVAN